MTGSSSSPGWNPPLKMAAANEESIESTGAKYGSLPPVVVAEVSSLSARAIESNRLGSALSFS